MTATRALPCLAGATLQLKDGGGLLAVRQPPLRASTGLPSSAQLEEGFARRRANERKLASKASANSNMKEGAYQAAELGAAAREEFVVKISRRDDILQVGDICIYRCGVVIHSPLSYVCPVDASSTHEGIMHRREQMIFFGLAKCCAETFLLRWIRLKRKKCVVQLS